jgi:hypothetical protein
LGYVGLVESELLCGTQCIRRRRLQVSADHGCAEREEQLDCC